MNRILRAIALSGIFIAAGRCLLGANQSEMTLALKPLTDSAVAGIPIVVELEIRNPGSKDAAAFDLTDPYLTFTSWVWKSSEGVLYKVSLDDYSYTAVPEPATPLPIKLKPGEAQKWMTTVPTPLDIHGTSRWELFVEIRPPTPYQSDVKTASAVLRCRTIENRCIAQTIAPKIAQAAMLDFARKDVLQRLAKEGKLAQIQACAKQGDLTAALIVFSNALLSGEGIAEHLRKLPGGIPEAKCLANYLLLLNAQGGKAIEAKERQALLQAVSDDDCLAEQVKKKYSP